MFGGGYCSEEIAVSFCLPVYNVAPYVILCIESIQNQHLDIEYEIICIDDCSMDNSCKLIRDFAKDHLHIRVLENEGNKGVSYTRNRLIREARGKYIWFVDPDDLLCAQSVERMFNAAMQVNADVFIGDYIRFPDGADSTASIPSQNEFQFTQGYELPKEKDGTVMCAVWAGLIKREFLLANKIFFHEKMIAQEDTLFYWEMKINKPIWYKCSHVCYFYRQRSSSVMHSHSDERSIRYFRSMREMLLTYSEQLDNITPEYREELKEKILHSHENVALILATITNSEFVRKQLHELEQVGLYPYPLRWELWNNKISTLRKVTQFVLPIKPLFWLEHYGYKIYDRIKHAKDRQV